MKRVSDFINEKKQLTYDQAMEIGGVDRKIQKHIADKYPDFGKIARMGHDINKGDWKKIEKQAKTDKELADLVDEYKSLEAKYK